MSGKVANARLRAQMIKGDVAEDAASLDATRFTGAAIGPVLGTLFAICGALAQCVIDLADEIDSMQSQLR